MAQLNEHKEEFPTTQEWSCYQTQGPNFGVCLHTKWQEVEMG